MVHGVTDLHPFPRHPLLGFLPAAPPSGHQLHACTPVALTLPRPRTPFPACCHFPGSELVLSTDLLNEGFAE